MIYIFIGLFVASSNCWQMPWTSQDNVLTEIKIQNEYTSEEIDKLKEKYGSKFDIPKSEANYTDEYNNSHPIWS